MGDPRRHGGRGKPSLQHAGDETRHVGAGTRGAVRAVRRDVLADIKDLLKEKEMSQDEERKAAEDVQKLTDKYVAEVEAVFSEKEKEVLKV